MYVLAYTEWNISDDNLISEIRIVTLLHWLSLQFMKIWWSCSHWIFNLLLSPIRFDGCSRHKDYKYILIDLFLKKKNNNDFYHHFYLSFYIQTIRSAINQRYYLLYTIWFVVIFDKIWAEHKYRDVSFE